MIARWVPVVFCLVPLSSGCGGRALRNVGGNPAANAAYAAEADAVAGRSSKEVAAAVLRHVRSPSETLINIPPAMVVVRRLYERDPHFIEKVMSEASDPKRDAHERGGLLASLGVLGEDAAPAVPRLVAIAAPPQGRRDKGWPSPARSGASVALRAIKGPAVPAVIDLIRTGTPEQAQAGVGLLDGMGAAARPAAPLLLARVDPSMPGRELVGLLGSVRTIDPGALRSREARAVLPRVLAIAEGREHVEQVVIAMEAGGLLRDMGIAAERAVPAMVRLVAKSRDEEGAGWGALGTAELIRPYGGAVGRELARLSGDADPAVREVAVMFMAVKELGPGDAAGRIARALRADGSADVRKAAAAALGGMGGRARGTAGALEAAARGDADPDVRAEAAEALARVRGRS